MRGEATVLSLQPLVLLPHAIVIVVHGQLLVILLQGREVVPGLGKLPLLHALTHVPVDEGPLVVHQVELDVEPGMEDQSEVSIKVT